MIIWRKSKNMLHGYRQFYCLHKNIFIKILQEMLKQDLTYESNKPLSKKKA